MPASFAYLIGAACIALMVTYFYRDRDTRGFDGAALAAASLAGVPLGAFVSLGPIVILCMIFGPVTQ